MKRFLCITQLIIIILFPGIVGAQYYDAGHEPGSVRWKVISTEKFDLIFTDTFRPAAQQLAAYLDSVIPFMQQGYGRHLPGIPIVLHNNMSIPNAFVGWAPSRMELYTMPPVESDAHDWLEQLAIHESVHWFQFSQMYQGMTGVFAKIFGEHIPAAVLGLYIPFWLIEGDAVYHETALSDAGRGRNADFEQLMRTHFVTRKPYNYNKAVLGSYRVRTADHYELGYQLVAYGSEQYGTRLWDSVYRYVARNPWNPVAFNTAMWKYAGKGKARYYREATAYLADRWRIADTINHHDSLVRFVKKPAGWAEYHRPLPWMMGDYIAERRTLDDINAIVRVDGEGREKVLFYPGYSQGSGISRADERIYYTAWSRHRRWPNIQYSDIWVYDFLRDTLARLTQHDRFFSPVEDPVNGEVYAIRYLPDHRFTLVKLDPDGEILNEYKLPAGMNPSQAGWWSAFDCLIFVGVTGKGKAIYSWDGESQILRRSEYTSANIGYPAGCDDGILFHAPFDGLNQIYLVLPETGVTLQITQSRFGAMYPTLDVNGDLLFSEVLPKGVAISSMSLDAWLMKEVKWPVSAKGFELADKFSPNPLRGFYIAELCDTCYTVSDYKHLPNLFRFHSWAPADIDPEQYMIKPGISMMSHNTLSTAFFRAGFSYDAFSLNREYFSEFTYKGFWPVLNASYRFTDAFYSDDNPDVEDFRYGMHDANFRINLPLSSVQRQWSKYFNIETGIYITDIIHFPGTHPQYPEGELFALFNRLYAHKLRRTAIKDIYPRWGQVIDIVLLNSIAGKLDGEDVMAVRLIDYYPGILRNQGLRVYFAAQKRFKGEDNNFNRLVAIPKGYANSEIEVNDALALQAMYKLPLLYPDLNLGPLAYIKRISASLFVDMITGSFNILIPSYYSYGFEVNADLHLLRHFAPVSFGYGLAVRGDGKLRSYFLTNVEFTL